MLRNVHTIISANSSFDKTLLNVAEGLRTNGIGVLTLKIALTGDSFPLQFSRSSMTRDDGKYPIQLFAFLKFLLAENRMLRLGNRGHS